MNKFKLTKLIKKKKKTTRPQNYWKTSKPPKVIRKLEDIQQQTLPQKPQNYKKAIEENCKPPKLFVKFRDTKSTGKTVNHQNNL